MAAPVRFKSLNSDVEGGISLRDASVPFTHTHGSGSAYLARITRHTKWFWVSVFLMLGLNLGLLLGSVEYMGDSFLLSGSDETQFNRVLASAMLFCFGIASAPIAVAVTYMLAIRSAEALGRVFVAAIVALIGLGCWGGVIASFASLMQTKLFYYAGEPIDFQMTFVGGIIIVMYTLLGAAGLCIAATLLCARPTPRHAPLSFTAAVQPSGFWVHAWKVVLLFMLYGAVWFLTSILPCMWNGTDGAGSIAAYFQTQSPFSLVSTVWTFSVPPPDNANDAPLLWSGQIFVKVYQDVFVYFSCLLGVSLLAVLGTSNATTRALLHKRLRGPPTACLPAMVRKWVNLWDAGVTVGELCLVCGVLGLYGYWLWYWSTGYTRIAAVTASYNDVYPELQNWARVMGHITNLSMSFMILPAARNSLWESVFGVPYERAIKYHRVLGRVTWLSVTIHMLLWYIKWVKEGTLSGNIVTVTNLVVSPGAPGGTHDNFTLVMVETAWLLTTVALIFAVSFRRRNWELFKYTHYVVYFFFAAALYHAWSLWYYLSGGLFLYAVDKTIRIIRSSRKAKVVSISHAADVTRIAVDADIFKRGFYAGQYAFLNIPAVSVVQWHPFTISSAPPAAFQDKVVTFHIRSQGEGSWTRELGKLAVAGLHAQDIQIGIDGPYGYAGRYYERDTVILIAGGIGITPIHSIFQDLYYRLTDPMVFGAAGNVRKVHVVWVCRDAGMFAVFADMLASALRSKKGTFEVHVHFTGDSATNVEGDMRAASSGMCDPQSAAVVASAVRHGRPNLGEIFRHATEDAIREQAASGNSSSARPRDLVSTFVCGPAALIQSVSDLAFAHDVDFHSEVFEL